jgi:hypothetical protein
MPYAARYTNRVLAEDNYVLYVDKYKVDVIVAIATKESVGRVMRNQTGEWSSIMDDTPDKYVTGEHKSEAFWPTSVGGCTDTVLSNRCR